MNSRVSRTEWGILIGAALVTDIIQALLDFFLVGAIINRFIDILVGMALPTYLYLRGVKMTKGRVGSMMGTFILEMIPVADALPLWTAEVLFIYATYITEEKLGSVANTTIEKIQTLKKPNFSTRSREDENILDLTQDFDGLPDRTP